MWLQKIWSQHFLDIVSFLELVYTAACIHKLLLTGEERVALTANIHFHLFNFFSSSGLERISASAYNRNFVIIGMYFGLHICSPRY